MRDGTARAPHFALRTSHLASRVSRLAQARANAATTISPGETHREARSSPRRPRGRVSAATRVAAASSVVVAATFARTLSSTNHHAGALRLIRAVRAIRGSRSVWLWFVAAAAVPPQAEATGSSRSPTVVVTNHERRRLAARADRRRWLRSIGEEITAASDLDDVLRGAEERHGVQTRVHRAAEKSLSLHRPDNGRERNGRPNPRHAARHSLRQSCSTPAYKPMGRCHAWISAIHVPGILSYC
jgi:hypothetical protein